MTPSVPTASAATEMTPASSATRWVRGVGAPSVATMLAPAKVVPRRPKETPAAGLRTTIHLRLVDELSYSEIALRLGISQEATRQHVSRGLRTLNHYLTEGAP
jgi:predicted DNA-binding protein (UPF0251 family)